MDKSTPKFHRMHYNFVAKRFYEINKEIAFASEKVETPADASAIDAMQKIIDLLMHNFIAAFAKDNQIFDSAKFIVACKRETRE